MEIKFIDSKTPEQDPTIEIVLKSKRNCSKDCQPTLLMNPFANQI